MKTYTAELTTVNAHSIALNDSWSADTVRTMCINHSYYTCGDCEAYEAMLNKVTASEPTPRAVYLVARDIATHSDLTAYGYNTTANNAEIADLEAQRDTLGQATSDLLDECCDLDDDIEHAKEAQNECNNARSALEEVGYHLGIMADYEESDESGATYEVDFLHDYITTYIEEREELQNAKMAQVEKLNARIEELTAQIDRLVDEQLDHEAVEGIMFDLYREAVTRHIRIEEQTECGDEPFDEVFRRMCED